MNTGSRARRAVAAGAAAIVLTGGGVAIGAVTTSAEPAAQAQDARAATSTMADGGAVAVDTGSRVVDGYADVVARVLPSVVLIRTDTGLGSGVVLDTAGHILTNAHVTGDSASFTVQVAGDAKVRPAHLVGSFAAGDLAVIQVRDAAGLRPAVFGDSAKARPGDVVLAVGNPFGLDGSVTEGIVSAIGRNVPEPATSGVAAALPDAIQTSAPINPGNSGGALVNSAGQVIGITTLVANNPGGGGQAQGIGFAIPSSLARDIASQLISSGHVTNSHRAALGAQVADVTSADGSPAGAGLVSLTAGGAADRAGLRAGDTIRSLGQVPTPDTAALAQALAATHPGAKVPVSFVRADHEMTVTVQLGEL